jgi:MoxR-like ATPase
LGQYDSVDLRGLPDLEGDLTTWRMPDSIPFVGNQKFDPDQKKILFLDELPAAKPAVLGVAYQLILNRRIGSHRLQPNTFIVCAGNRDGDKGVQNKLPAPLNNRMTHYEVAPDAKAWVQWAGGQPRIPAEMLALLSFRPDLITDFDPMTREGVRHAAHVAQGRALLHLAHA